MTPDSQSSAYYSHPANWEPNGGSRSCTAPCWKAWLMPRLQMYGRAPIFGIPCAYSCVIADQDSARQYWNSVLIRYVYLMYMMYSCTFSSGISILIRIVGEVIIYIVPADFRCLLCAPPWSSPQFCRVRELAWAERFPLIYGTSPGDLIWPRNPDAPKRS